MDPMTDEPGPPRRRLGGILVDPAPLQLTATTGCCGSARRSAWSAG